MWEKNPYGSGSIWDAVMVWGKNEVLSIYLMSNTAASCSPPFANTSIHWLFPTHPHPPAPENAELNLKFKEVQVVNEW